MKSTRIYLQFLIMTSLTAALYPLLVLLSSCSGKSGLLAIGMTLLSVVLMWLGVLLVLIFRRTYRKKPRRMNGILWTLTVLLFLGGCFLAPYSTTLVQMCYGIVAGACFFCGSRLVFQPLENLAHPYVFAGLCMWDVLLGVLLHLLEVNAFVLPTAILLAVNAALFALAHNLSSLERILRGRSDGVWELPQEVHRSNTRLMTVLFLIGIGLLCCYRPLARLLRWLLHCVFTGVCDALRWLLSLWSSDVEDNTAETVSDQLMQTEQSGAAPWIRLVIYLVLFGGTLALLIWKRREIRDALIQLWCALRRWIRTKLEQAHQLPEERGDGAYCDYVEDLQIGDSLLDPQKTVFSRRRWNRRYRQYQHMPTDATRFRLGYALVLSRLPEGLVQPSDSTREILKKTEHTEDSNWNVVTVGYDAVRYGELAPDVTAFSALNMLLEQLYHTKTK